VQSHDLLLFGGATALFVAGAALLAGRRWVDFSQRTTLGMAAFAALLLVQIVLVARIDSGGSHLTANYGFAVGIGLLVGATEMISRYRDDPLSPVVSSPGALYVLINGGAAALAYYLLLLLEVPLDEPMRTLTAGFAAMTFFRSGLFTIRLGNADVAVGPHLVMQVILHALDRTYDRQRAVPRSEAVSEIMRGLSFDNVKEALPTLCFDLMQNVSDAEVREINTHVAELSASSMAEDAKILSLGLALFNVVGERTLSAAVRALGNNAMGFRRVSQQMLLDLAAIDPEVVVSNLPKLCAALPSSGDAPVRQPRPVAQEVPDLNAEGKAVLVLYELVDVYGDQRVAVAIGILANSARDAERDGDTLPPGDG
jgi:hypothetical protein